MRDIRSFMLYFKRQTRHKLNATCKSLETLHCLAVKYLSIINLRFSKPYLFIVYSSLAFRLPEIMDFNIFYYGLLK
jgi:hypothetical protein